MEIIQKYYHKPTMFAYFLLPGIESPEEVYEMLSAVRDEGIEPPLIFELRRVGEGAYWGHSILKFILHPSIPYEQEGWMDMDRKTAGLLQPEKYILPV